MFLFLFRVSPSPCRHKSTPSSFQSRRRRNPSSAIRKSSEEKKRNEALCGREDTKGDLKQNGFEAVELARLKITIKDDKIVVKSKLFPSHLNIISGIHHSVPLQLRHSLTPEQMAFEECPNITERKLEGKFRWRNRNEIGCRQRGQEKSAGCPHLLLMLWFELMRTPCPSTACGFLNEFLLYSDKLAYETINNLPNYLQIYVS